MGKKLVPELRFPEFSGEWERQKLSNITKRIIRKNSDEQSNHVLTISGEMGLIDQEEYFNKRVASKNLENYYLLYKNEFAYNKSYSNGYPFGAIKKLTRYDKGVLSSLYICFEPKKDTCIHEYLEKYFETDKWHKEISKIAVEGARNHGLLNIGINDFFETKHHLPSNPEQEKIANFFNLIDKKIEKQEEKIASMEEYKRGMMQKLFPKKGENVPEIRFKGFTDPWEQRKLGELTNIKTGSSDLKDADNNGEYPFFVRSENIERSNRYIFEGEAILIPGEGRLGDIYHYINGKFDYHQRVYKISDFEDLTTDGKFVLYYLQQNFKRHALKFTVKATVDSLRLPMLVDFEIKLPSYGEQKLIGIFFKTLDNLITLHQRKLEELKELKKGFMQKMFI